MARSNHTLDSTTNSPDDYRVAHARLPHPVRPRQLLSAAIVLALSVSGHAIGAEGEAIVFAADTPTAPANQGQQALPLPFDQAVKLTLSQNAAVDLSQARIAEARAAIDQANGNLLPTLDLSFGVMGSNNPLNVFGMKLQQEQASFNDFGAGEFFEKSSDEDQAEALATEPDNLNDPGWHQNVQTSLKLSVPVYNGGKIREMRTQAHALLQAAQSGDEAARQQLVLHTIEAYAGINTAEAFVDVASQARGAASSFRDLSQKLYDEGVVTRADLLKAEVNLGERELDLEAARNQADNAADGLK
ncbi:MAG: TolC family protein, partial [Guyparkeria sp.]